MAAYSREDLKLYLEYLEKEMNIMGVLSAFCALAPALTIRELLEHSDGSHKYIRDVWENGQPFIVVGTLLILAAAGFFYGQRSNLAWFYGQISLAFLDTKITGQTIHQWLCDADSWATWNRYKRSFCYLTLGAVGYSIGLCGPITETFNEHVWIKTHLWDGFYLYSLIVVCAVLIEAQVERIYSRYPYENSPLTLRRFMTLRL